jgi:hypothetical protein
VVELIFVVVDVIKIYVKDIMNIRIIFVNVKCHVDVDIIIVVRVGVIAVY